MGLTIDQVAWHTTVESNTETRAQIVERFWQIAHFLQKNGLSKRSLTCARKDIDDYFSISTDDLTDRGIEIIKKGYDKWLERIDKGMSPSGMTLLKICY